VLDRDGMSREYIRKIEENRKDYAARHGTWKRTSRLEQTNNHDDRL